MKKLLVLFFASFFFCSVFSQTYFTVGDYTYKKSNDSPSEVSLYTFNNKDFSGDLIIPSNVTYSGTNYNVVGILNGSFSGCSEITSITISQNIKYIELLAFLTSTYSSHYYLNSIFVNPANQFFVSVDGVLFSKDMKTIVCYPSGKLGDTYNIPSGVTSIAQYAFSRCQNINSISIPVGVTEIPDHAFSFCFDLTSVIIPEGVTSIGYGAFFESALQSVVLPESLVSIGREAFSDCQNLTSISIPVGVTKIQKYTFSHCSDLTSVIIPEGITAIEQGAFYSSGLQSIVLPESLVSIGRDAFHYTNISSITIPKSVTNINGNAFLVNKYNPQSNHFTSIFVDPANQFYASVDGVLFSKDMKTLISYPSGKLGTTYNIPSGVTRIGTSAFSRCQNLTSVFIPVGVTEIEYYAFSESPNLTSVIIPEGVTTIGYGAFGYSGLQSVVLPESLISIGGSAFSRTKLSSITIPESVTSIAKNAFTDCSSLKTFNFDAKNCKIEGQISLDEYSGLFYNSSVKTINIGEKVQAIPDSLFRNTPYLETINYNATNCTYFGNAADNDIFRHCNSLTTVNIGENVKSIPIYAFNSCHNLTTVNYNAINCTTVGSSTKPAFLNCASLKTLTVGPNVTSIPDYAFYGLTNLETINYNAINCTSIGNAYNEPYLKCTKFSTLNIGDEVENLPHYGFYKCSKLASLKMGNSLKNLGTRTFTACTSLTSVTIPASVTSFGINTFYGCTGLTTVNYNATNCTSMGYIYYPVFDQCSSLSTLNIGDNVENIPNYAFYNCSAITKVTIPEKVSNIGIAAFYNCTNLSQVNFNATNCLTMGDATDYVFSSGCNSFKTLIVGDNVISIPKAAFYNCSSLNSVTLGSSLSNIGNNAFSHCSSLTSLTIPTSVTNIGNSAFSYCVNLVTVNFNATNCTAMGNSTYPVFNGCSLFSTLNISDNVQNIPAYSFYGCSKISSLSIGYSVKKIGDYAFYNNSALTTLTIPDNVESIGGAAFYNCTNLAQVNFNAINCLTMGNATYGVFSSSNTALKTLIIGDNVISIPNSAFYGCSKLTKATIGKSVTSIAEYAFLSCSALTELTCNAILPPSCYTNSVSSINKTIPVYIPCESEELYKTAPLGWNLFTNYQCNSVTVEVAEENSIMGTVLGSGNYTRNSTTTIEAIPNYGYHFVKWNDNNTDNPRTITVSQDLNFTAEFEKNKYSISLETDNTKGLVTGAGIYDYLTSILVTAIPNPDYHFVKWSDENTDNPRTINVTDNLTLTAVLAIDTYSVTLNSDSEMGSVNGSGVFDVHTITNIEAVANYGYHFVKWNDNNTDNPRTITVSQDLNFTAEFEKNKYSISLETDNTKGSVTGAGIYDYLTSISLTAIPNPDYHFVKWSDDNTENPRTINVTEDLSLTALFAIDNYSITLNADSEMGSVNGSGVFDVHTITNIEAIANTDYHFVKWSDDNTENPRTINVTDNLTLTALFAIDTYSITLNANSEQGSVVGSGVFDVHTTTEIEAIANPDYHFVKWSDDNTDNPRTINVSEDLSLTALFAIDTYSITLNADSEMGSVNGSGVFDVHTIITIEAIANEAYAFEKWSDDNTDNPRTINVTENLNLTAIFKNASSVQIITNEDIFIYSQDKRIIIKGLTNQKVSVFDTMGCIIYTGTSDVISVNKTGVYIVKIEDKTQKVIVK